MARKRTRNIFFIYFINTHPLSHSPEISILEQILSYNASAVQIYNVARSHVLFEIKDIFFCSEKTL
jgi:hypothetical protein